MLRLVVTRAGRPIKTYQGEAPRVRIGRNPDNELQIDSQGVSRYHCLLHQQGEEWIVEDLQSSNGTYLNNAQLKDPCRVRAGDTLTVGGFVISVDLDECADRSAANRNSISDRIAVRPTRDPETRQLLANEKAYLLRLNSPGAALVITHDLTQFGAAPGADVPLEGPHTQAVLIRGYGGFQLVRTAPGELSRNDEPLQRLAWLEEGDTFAVGALRFSFHQGVPVDEQATLQLKLPPGGFAPPA